MAQKTILQIVRDAAGRIGLNKPNTATGSTDIQIVQLVDLANEEGQELTSRFDWQELVREKTFSTLANEDQGLLVGGILVDSDGYKKILNDTIFNRTQRIQTPGPISPRLWAGLKATTNMSGFDSQYRLRGGHLLLYPRPAAGEQLAFEYKTENWVSSAAGDQFRAQFEMDEDFPLFDSQLVTAGLIWRWKAAKGLEYAEDFNKYEARVAQAMTENKTARSVKLDECDYDEVSPFIAVPRGNWTI